MSFRDRVKSLVMKKPPPTDALSLNSPRKRADSDAEPPMPSSEEVAKQYEKAIQQMGVTDENKLQNLRAQFKTPEQQWQFICMMNKAEKKGTTAKQMVEKLKTTIPLTKVLLQTVTVELRTQKTAWVEEFLNENGIYHLTTHLAAINAIQTKEEQDFANQSDLIKCFASCLKVELGLKKFLTNPDTLQAVVLTTYDCPYKMRTSILLILSLIVQHSPDAFQLTLGAISSCRVLKREDVRFSYLAGSLTEQNDAEYKIHLCIFLNVLLNNANDPVLRYEIIQDLNKLNIKQKLNSVTSTAHDFLTQKKFLLDQLAEDFSGEITNPVEITKMIASNMTVEGLNILKDILHMFLQLSAQRKLNVYNFKQVNKTLLELCENIDDMGKIITAKEKQGATSSAQFKQLQQAMSNLESKVRSEKQLMLQMLSQNLHVNPDEFDLLRDVALQLNSSEPVPMSSFNTQVPVDEDALPTPSEVAQGMMDDDGMLPTPSEALQDDSIYMGGGNYYNNNDNTGDDGALPTPSDEMYDMQTQAQQQQQQQTNTYEQPQQQQTQQQSQGSQQQKPNSSEPVKQNNSVIDAMQQVDSLFSTTPASNKPAVNNIIPKQSNATNSNPSAPAPKLPNAPTTNGPPMPIPQAINLPPLPTYTPKNDLRTFHLDTINRTALSKSIFVKGGLCEQTANIKLEFDAIEDMFSVKKGPEKLMNMNQEQKKESLVTLIDSKRSHNLSITITSLRMPYEQIRKGIIEMDESLLGPKMNILLKIMPTPDEMELISSYDDDIATLGEPEKFFYHLRDIPNVQQRVEAWAFKLRFASEVESLVPELDSVIKACKEMRENKKFLHILTVRSFLYLIQFIQVMLAIINYMNAKTNKKNAYGFRLASLSKLNDTKSGDGKSNLFNYIVDYIQRNEPDKADFYKEFTSVPIAKRVNMPTIKESITSMQKSLLQAMTLVDQYQNVVLQGDKFYLAMLQFTDTAIVELQNLNTKNDTATKELETLVESFGDDKSNANTEYIGAFHTFLLQFESTRKKLIEQKEKDAKKAAKQASNTNNSSPLSSPLSSPVPTSGQPAQVVGFLGDLEKSLRQGTAFKRLQSFNDTSK